MNSVNGTLQLMEKPEEKPVPDPMPHPAKPQILVIDDENGIRRMLNFALGKKGYEVTTASNGEEGVQQAQKSKFDVVISDLTMPQMGGLDALAFIKEIDPNIEVIIVTGYATVDTAVQCMKRGAYDYITKPFQIEDLCRLVERALDKKRLNLRVDQLQELNRLKSEFLATMSHELRTPMNAIIGYTALVVDGIYGIISDDIRKALLRVAANAKNLLQLINNILDLSKLTSGRMPVYIENCNLRDIAKEVVETLGILAQEKKLTLGYEADEDLCVASDKTKLKQVLINLVGNGITFTRQGGVAIKMERLADRPFVQIQVKDTGVGMKPEDLPLLFQEFKQLDSSYTRAHGGTGLGLAISKAMVKLLGGTIKVESVPDVGSTFTVTLPLENSKTKAEVIPPISSNLTGSQSKVLLAIDDDPEVLKLLKDSLKDTDYAFAGAQSGEEGLALARQLKPAVITLDILMPHMDGWSVLQLIKNDPKLASIPVIILSILENKALGFSLGVTDYIVKPFERKILLDKLKHLGKNKAEMSDGKSSNYLLVVEDDPSVKDFFNETFKKENISIRVAKNGAEALAAMAKEKPDLLFLNLMQPHVNGFDVLQVLPKDPALKDIPTIVITAQRLTSQEKEYLQKRVEMIAQKESVSLPEVMEELKKKIVTIKPACHEQDNPDAGSMAGREGIR